MSVTEVVLIAALDRKLAIGRDNDLPWRLPDDLKRFKAITLGHPILMGRKTAQSLGRALPGRRNLVLTRGAAAPFAGMQAVDCLANALLASRHDQRLCVIGGGEVYALCLPLAKRMHLTHVDVEVEAADAFFPAFDRSQWQIEACTEHSADSRHLYSFRFVDYQRAPQSLSV